MKPIKVITNGALLALCLNSGAAQAISNAVTIDFTNLAYAGFSGKANLQPRETATATNGFCSAGLGEFSHYEDGMAVGVVYDSGPAGGGTHLHSAGADRAVSYHSDSSGIYIRAKDSSAFSLTSLDFNATIGPANPGTGADDFWEIIGFDTALNPTLDTDTAPTASQVAFQAVANGFSGTLALNSDFGNINAFWIHYHGWPRVPYDLDAVYDGGGDLVSDGPFVQPAFAMLLDNVHVGAPVPLPTAAWLMGSGLLGFLVAGRRKA